MTTTGKRDVDGLLDRRVGVQSHVTLFRGCDISIVARKPEKRISTKHRSIDECGIRHIETGIIYIRGENSVTRDEIISCARSHCATKRILILDGIQNPFIRVTVEPIRTFRTFEIAHPRLLPSHSALCVFNEIRIRTTTFTSQD